jgi:hypothetical protein
LRLLAAGLPIPALGAALPPTCMPRRRQDAAGRCARHVQHQHPSYFYFLKKNIKFNSVFVNKVGEFIEEREKNIVNPGQGNRLKTGVCTGRSYKLFF